MGARYRKNASAVCSLKYHLVWCPKYRRSVLTGEVETRLRELLHVVAGELGVIIHTFEVMPDHVHLFVEADPTKSVAEMVGRFKGITSHALRKEFPRLRSRLPTLWNRAYYAGTVGAVSEVVVRRYIEAQRGK